MEPNKDKRMGKKTSLWPSIARKQRCRVKGRFSNANKENIPATNTVSESCSAGISINTANVAKNLREANIVATHPPNWSPEGSSKQVIVQAEVHNEPSRSNWKNVVPRKMMRSDNYRDQSDWDIIEPDVASARSTPDLITPVTQTELTSPCNKSSDSNSDINLPVEIISKDNSNINTILEGNRIVNIAYLFEQIKNVSHHPFQCNFQYLDFVKEQRTGFYSQFYFKCRLCNKMEKIRSQPCYQGSKENPINLNIIEGVSQTGNGWAQLDEICASINMPNMSETYYVKKNKELSTIQKDIALQFMLEAGAEERRLAFENHEVDSQGVPCITVVTDGSWAKRSYGTNFNSLSGVGCIIGHRTKKVLYIGVKNSYCCICALGNNKKRPIRTHECFKNWSGPSTEMETSAIVDGFKVSMEMHGVKYTKVIGDGDSSVTNALRDSLIYGPDVHIRKIECSNHLLRNYSNKLRKIGKKTENKVGFVPVSNRKVLLERVRRLYNAVTGAVAHARQLEVPTAEKLLVLKEDLRNGPCHVFGWHDSCKPYYCKKKMEENLVPQLKSSGLWNDIYETLGWLFQNAESLLLKETNNPAEQFNAIVAKFLAGKRVNFTRRGTYEARCFAAAGHYNSRDYSFVRKVQNAVCPDAPDNTYIYTDKYVQKKTKLLTKQRKRTAADKAQGNKRAKRFKMADKHYGDVIEVPDMPQEVFEKKKTEFILALKMTAEEISILEKSTIAQGNSDLWIVERKKRITASIFGQVCKMKDSTPCTSLVKTILYSSFTGNDATRYGKAHEATAITDLEKKIEQTVTPCGLFIDIENPYLGASPDGLLGPDSIVEVKCPASAAAYTPMEAIRLKKITFCTETEDGIKLKNNHNYYYQVQGQLKITQRKYCYFVVWTLKGIEIEKIEFDPTFWTQEKINKLKQFYFKCVLPELIDPRFPRKMAFRDRF